ncbi:MAG TPA: MOSC domain-containing protein [Thermoanaerobaculia bacterium]
MVLLSEEAWNDATAELGMPLDLSTRRGNLLLSGVDLEKTRGQTLRIGAARLRIFMECTPCERMEQACPGLQEFLKPHWRGGACAEVLAGGEIRVGDEVEWEEEGQRVLPLGGQGT